MKLLAVSVKQCHLAAVLQTMAWNLLILRFTNYEFYFFFRTGIPTGGKTGRRGSRPFLSPDALPAASLVAALQTHRDSLSPDSAAEEAASGAVRRGRRDSRPHLSPDGEGGGFLNTDGSSPSGRRMRRQSTTTNDDVYK